MSFYPSKISEKIARARNAGTIGDASVVGTGASLECGTFVRFFLRVERETRLVSDAKYKSSGCGFTIAAAERLCESIKGKKLNELHGLDEKFLIGDVETALGEFGAARAHCLEICMDALRAAFKNYRRAQIEEFNGEQALICTCFGVSEDAIENLIARESIETVEQVTDACNAGGGCGSCQPLIQEILDSHG